MQNKTLTCLPTWRLARLNGLTRTIHFARLSVATPSRSAKPTSWRATEPSSKPLGTIRSLNLHAERTQDVDSPTRPGFPVLFILGHRCGDFAIYQPVAAMNVVVVPTRSRALSDEGANMFDSGKPAHGAALGGGRHGERGWEVCRASHCWRSAILNSRNN